MHCCASVTATLMEKTDFNIHSMKHLVIRTILLYLISLLVFTHPEKQPIFITRPSALTSCSHDGILSNPSPLDMETGVIASIFRARLHRVSYEHS